MSCQQHEYSSHFWHLQMAPYAYYHFNYVFLSDSPLCTSRITHVLRGVLHMQLLLCVLLILYNRIRVHDVCILFQLMDKLSIFVLLMLLLRLLPSLIPSSPLRLMLNSLLRLSQRFYMDIPLHVLFAICTRQTNAPMHCSPSAFRRNIVRVRRNMNSRNFRKVNKN